MAKMLAIFEHTAEGAKADVEDRRAEKTMARIIVKVFVGMIDCLGKEVLQWNVANQYGNFRCRCDVA